MLAVRNIHKKFGKRTVLDDVSLRVNKGAIAVLMGPSGVGKSTLLRIISGLEIADTGDMKLNNHQMISSAKTVGMLFQHFNLFENMTVLENLVFPLIKGLKLSKQDATKRAMEYIDKYALNEVAHQYPHNLSGGQKQRVALARTVLMKPAIICLDEPTSSLDPLLTTYVAEMLHELAREGFTIIVSSHDINFIQKLDADLYLMDKGTIGEHAKASEFKKDRAAFPRMSEFLRQS